MSATQQDLMVFAPRGSSPENKQLAAKITARNLCSLSDAEWNALKAMRQLCDSITARVRDNAERGVVEIEAVNCFVDFKPDSVRVAVETLVEIGILKRDDLRLVFNFDRLSDKECLQCRRRMRRKEDIQGVTIWCDNKECHYYEGIGVGTNEDLAFRDWKELQSRGNSKPKP